MKPEPCLFEEQCNTPTWCKQAGKCLRSQAVKPEPHQPITWKDWLWIAPASFMIAPPGTFLLWAIFDLSFLGVVGVLAAQALIFCIIFALTNGGK